MAAGLVGKARRGSTLLAGLRISVFDMIVSFLVGGLSGPSGRQTLALSERDMGRSHGLLQGAGHEMSQAL
jgi:hypothetical protein